MDSPEIPSAKPAADNSRRTLHIGGLPLDVTKEEIYDLVVIFGEIKTVELPTDKQSGAGRGFAYVEFVEAVDAREAIVNLDGSELRGRILNVSNIRKFD